MNAPAKRWRVCGSTNRSADYSSEAAAYDDIRARGGWGTDIRVYHWERGDWRLYERIEPAAEAGDALPPGGVISS